jgi:hypothetical protein
MQMVIDRALAVVSLEAAAAGRAEPTAPADSFVPAPEDPAHGGLANAEAAFVTLFEMDCGDMTARPLVADVYDVENKWEATSDFRREPDQVWIDIEEQSIHGALCASRASFEKGGPVLRDWASVIGDRWQIISVQPDVLLLVESTFSHPGLLSSGKKRTATAPRRGSVRFWAKHQYLDPSSKPDFLGESTLIDLEIDCAEGRDRRHQFVSYGPSGKQTASTTVTEWSRPVPETKGERWVRFACNREKRVNGAPQLGPNPF